MSPDQRPEQGPLELSPIHRLNHNVIWPLMAHTVGLRALHAAYMYGFAHIKEGDHILELGAGDVPYYRLFGFSKRVGESGAFHVVDIDPSVLSRARRITEAVDSRSVRRGRRVVTTETFTQAAAQQLPFPNESMDTVIMSNLDTSGYAEEVFRVTKPGGRVLEAWLEPFVPVFSWAKMRALHKAGFRHLRLQPGTPTLPLPVSHALPQSPVPFVPFMNWVVMGEKPNPLQP